MNKLHEPAPSLKLQQHAFLSTRLLIQVSAPGFHPVAEVDEDHSGRQGNEPGTQNAIRLNRQRTGKVGLVLCKEVAFPKKRLWKRRTQFGDVFRKLPGHPSEVFPYPGIGQLLDGFERTFKADILMAGRTTRGTGSRHSSLLLIGKQILVYPLERLLVCLLQRFPFQVVPGVFFRAV